MAAPIQRIQVQPRVGQRSVAPRWIKDDLVPLARYVVTVTTFSGDKTSEECRNAQVIKPHPPQITVNDEDITSNSIHLSWSVSEGSPGETWYKFDEVPEARVKNYIVSISPKHAMPSTVIKTSDEIQDCPAHTFTNLQPGTEYTLTVYVQYIDRSSEVVMTAESECKSWTLPEKPGPLQIEEPSPTTVKVSWSPSNGRVDHYLIEMKSESMTSKGILKKLETKGTTCTFHDVDPFVTYVISVQAIRGLRKSEAAFAEKRPVYEEQQGPLVFISHAGEDKEAFVEPLLAALFEEGLSEGDIFFDKFSIFTGDTIRHEIVSAISNKTLKLFVLVVSKNFFGKNKYWPRLEYELSLKENIPLYPIWLDENDDNFKNFSSFVGEKSSLLKGKRATCVGYTENADDVKKAAREIAFKVSPWLKPRTSTTTGSEPFVGTLDRYRGPTARVPGAATVPVTTTHPTEGPVDDDIPERGDSKHSCEHRHNEDVPQSHKHGEGTPGQAQGDDDVTRLNKQTQDMEQSGWEVVTLMTNKKTGEKRTIASLACKSFLESNPDMAARFQQFVMTNQSESLDSDGSHTG
ncbi:uncharacterized protein LOC118411929 isoform X2 [Branchiostoma floridae]|uniref:Uncharacterized protein LOC118411929 isoform X2 n=1 Tax=Branchiostoma floridae TaxID=7739 RepID=A0A9J7MJX9_BRAFL|nr:uncharacterized protein LOC118411929 isoform X2 [Branchiostoma floridae]